MPSVGNPNTLARLVTRLRALTPTSARRWGTLTPHEMLCHLGDAADSVLTRGRGGHARRRPLVKWIALYTPLPWPRGVRTLPSVNPREDGTKPTDFDTDRDRAIEGLANVARATPDALPDSHSIFGAMSAEDWYRWAYRHTDHHLRQFGL